MCYKFARDIDGANIEALQQVILEIKPFVADYNIDSEDKVVKKYIFLQELTYMQNNLNWIVSFAKDVKDADIEAFQQLILKSKDTSICHDFATKVKGANISALNKRIEEIVQNGRAEILKRFR